MAKAISLYELVGMKRKNSVLKSVFIDGSRTFEGYFNISVEAYDDTFLDATRYDSEKDKTSYYIDKMIKKNVEKIQNHFNINDTQFWIADYSTFDRHFHYILDTKKELYNCLK